MKILLFAVFLFITGCSGIGKKNSISICYEPIHCMAMIKQEVESNWRRPFIGSTDKKAKIEIEIDSGYKVVRVEITQSSGSKEYDDSIITAVNNSSPFSMLSGLSLKEKERFKKMSFVFGATI